MQRKNFSFASVFKNHSHKIDLNGIPYLQQKLSRLQMKRCRCLTNQNTKKRLRKKSFHLYLSDMCFTYGTPQIRNSKLGLISIRDRNAYSYYESDEPKPESDNEKTIVVDECLIDVIKTMNGIIKDERAKIEKFRESDHKHYQESVDELHRELGIFSSTIL